MALPSAREPQSRASTQPLACRLVGDVDATMGFLDEAGEWERDFEFAVDSAGNASVIIARTPRGAALVEWLVHEGRAEPVADLPRVTTHRHLVALPDEPASEPRLRATNPDLHRGGAEPPPPNEEPIASDVAVLVALSSAIRARRVVTIVIRGDVPRGVPARAIEGIPIGFSRTVEGKNRVVLQIVEGQCEQWVLIERIARVLPVSLEMEAVRLSSRPPRPPSA